jgi:cyanate lyase
MTSPGRTISAVNFKLDVRKVDTPTMAIAPNIP